MARPLARRLPTTSAVNHRGASVPLSLGFALTAGVATSLLAGTLPGLRGAEVPARDLWLLVSVGLVFIAGVYDDRQPARVHGLRRHAGELVHGRVTSGMLKLVAAIVAALVWALASSAGGASGHVWRTILGVPVMAGAANLWNLLDVAPGRALKASLPVAIALLLAGRTGLAWAALLIAVVLLPLDLGERGMLGDAGSNVLGFVLGVLAFDRLATPGLAVVLAVILLLHAVAETVTLSRIIRGAAVLRFLDDLGRVRPVDPTAGDHVGREN
jgi:hypothetical protein